MITAQAPGKLYIAGEYAVVETGLPAIIVALNQFVTVTIEESQHYGSIVSKQYQENSLYWSRQGDELVFDNRDNPFHYILSAIRLTEKYVREMGKPLALYHLHINSELDSQDGKKYGLGSSAAVTVATVKALLDFYQVPLTKDRLYKLAAIAHLDVQGNGSLGDIAASVYGGWIAYRSFDRSWLAAIRRETTLVELINMDWPQLSIELLTPPENLQLMIGWTGSPASTSQLVDRITIAKAKRRDAYHHFLHESKLCLEQMIAGFKAKDLKQIQAQIRRNRELLHELSDFSQVSIETPLLQKMCDLAESFHGAAKSSGAGGGDCGIALLDKTLATEKLAKSWIDAGIEQLDLAVHHVTL
ncbi:phosphomevalonate kinase [Loigolactobacillus bifermentans]|uniref:phosphomevalonate kinase n=1 Tax=Loigolactobacillus bifermentans DSM 20003 TaxID=1423726 RepID=A0A0R1GPH0_9LACO|nr:phosphomevalonate kinase [Loigolactobacillus bifermentans]KRK32775.1 phosphomevalonate kinase [Loigolactobacillus bifermentans DSM 20003]QGG59430.1 phosphomevalonate kinase [Loigolactobacillus bifermentans]